MARVRSRNEGTISWRYFQDWARPVDAGDDTGAMLSVVLRLNVLASRLGRRHWGAFVVAADTSVDVVGCLYFAYAHSLLSAD